MLRGNMRKYRLQDTQKILGSRTDANLKKSILSWRNQLKDVFGVIIKGDKLDILEDDLVHTKTNVKDPNAPLIPDLANASLVETLPVVARKIDLKPQGIASKPGDIDPKLREEKPMNNNPSLNRVFKKKLVRNSAFISLNRTYGSVDAREILTDLNDLLQELKSGGKTIPGRG